MDLTSSSWSSVKFQNWKHQKEGAEGLSYSSPICEWPNVQIQKQQMSQCSSLATENNLLGKDLWSG